MGAKTRLARHALPVGRGGTSGVWIPTEGQPHSASNLPYARVFLSIQKTTILFKSLISLLTTSVSYVSNKGKQHKGGIDRMATLYVRDVPKDLHSRVKIQAIKEGMTLQAIVLKALEEYLERQGG